MLQKVMEGAGRLQETLEGCRRWKAAGGAGIRWLKESSLREQAGSSSRREVVHGCHRSSLWFAKCSVEKVALKMAV